MSSKNIVISASGEGESLLMVIEMWKGAAAEMQKRIELVNKMEADDTSLVYASYLYNGTLYESTFLMDLVDEEVIEKLDNRGWIVVDKDVFEKMAPDRQRTEGSTVHISCGGYISFNATPKHGIEPYGTGVLEFSGDFAEAFND